MDFFNDFFLPPARSTQAQSVDPIFGFIHFVSAVLLIALIIAIVYFVIKYRRKSKNEVTPYIRQHIPLEITWTIIPLVLVFLVFGWGYKGYMELYQPPEDAYEIHATGQTWLWRFEYPNGVTTTNTLHVPAKKPVRLIMQSNDVIHSFFVPAYRIKKDVVPNQYTSIWFEVKEPGESDLFCAEYCGTGHSDMTGTVVAHSQQEFQDWLADQKTGEEAKADMSPIERGEELFKQNACNSCHSLDGTKMTGPTLKGIYEHEVKLKSGKTVEADENYLRESILNPQAKIVAGYPSVMPTFKGQLSDEEIDALIAFIKEQ